MASARLLLLGLVSSAGFLFAGLGPLVSFVLGSTLGMQPWATLLQWSLLGYMGPIRFLFQWVGGSGRIFLKGAFISFQWSFCARVYDTFLCLVGCHGRISTAAHGLEPQHFRPGSRPGRGFHNLAKQLFSSKLVILTLLLHGLCWMLFIVLNSGQPVRWILFTEWTDVDLRSAAARALEGARRQLLAAYGETASALHTALLTCFFPGVLLLLVLSSIVLLGGSLTCHGMLAQDRLSKRQLSTTTCHCQLRTTFHTAYAIGLEVRQRLWQRPWGISHQALVQQLLPLRLALLLPLFLLSQTLLLQGQGQGLLTTQLWLTRTAQPKQLARRHRLPSDGHVRALVGELGGDLEDGGGVEAHPGGDQDARAELDSGQGQPRRLHLVRPYRRALHHLRQRQPTWNYHPSPAMTHGTPRISPGWPQCEQLLKSYGQTGVQSHHNTLLPRQILWTAFSKQLREGKKKLTQTVRTLSPRILDLADFPRRGLLLVISVICLAMRELDTARNPKTEGHSFEFEKWSVSCFSGLYHCLLWLYLSAFQMWQVRTSWLQAGLHLSGWMGDVPGKIFHQRQPSAIHRSLQPNMTNTTSRLGPKSQARCRAIAKAWRGSVWLLFWVLLFSSLQVGLAARDVRVSSLPTELLGAVSTDTAKHRGSSRSTLNAATLPTARKRSYRRAVHRAMHSGSTFYRGKVFTCSDLQRLDCSSQTRNKQPHKPPQSKRIRTLCVNFDGMTAPIYDSFALWLQDAPYDVVLMQELHRGFGDTEAEWEAAEWMIISSPDPRSRFAGVAIAVRKSLVKGNAVRSADILPGRLLHVRISGAQFGIDLISCYQHVISSREPRSKTAAKRELIWSTLGRYLSSLPRRNVLILGGDFNCSVVAHTGIAGASTPPPSEYYFDQDDFLALAKAPSLCFLNTWTRRSGGAMNTFLNGAHSSQIDYILTRCSQADSLAKQSRPVPGLDFSPWRLGARHAPVQASTPLKPGWLSQTSRRPQTDAYDKLALEDSLHRRDQQSQVFFARVQAAVADLGDYTAEALNQLLLQQCMQVYPKQHRPRAPRPWQNAQVQTSVRAMWTQRQALRRVGHNVRLGLFSVRHVFHAFREFARFQRSYRELRRQGKAQRRQMLVNKLQEASQAAERKDTKSLYQVIRQISPKQLRGKVRIRSTDGQLLTPLEEHAEISDYFRDLFGTDREDLVPQARLDPVLLERHEIEISLSKLGAGRAVPQGHAPSSAWKFCRQALSAPLLEVFHSETMAGFPHWWADCSLTLIPKPAKTIRRPESLRPLGIQDAAGKAISRVIKDRLFEQIRDKLEQYPQFAYLQHRSTTDAIQRVAEHCQRIRSQICSDRTNVFKRKLGRKRAKYIGGAQLALDMTTAFDRLPRQSLADSLTWAQVDDSLASLILDIHCACRYHVDHEGNKVLLDMKNGVRQGCTLAPLLWALFSTFLLSRIEQVLDSEWPKTGMTLYADDTHCAWEFSSLQDINFMQRSVNAVFQVYRQHGMLINESKSAFLIRLGGTHGAKWLKPRLHLLDGKKHIRLCQGLQTVSVPVVKQVKYLGIIVSYQDFELASVRHRLQCAGISRQRLAKVMHSSRHLTLKQRLQIYQVCVRTSLLYGVTAFSLPPKALLALHRRDIKYIRAIAKSPVHITRERTHDLLIRLDLPSIDLCIQKTQQKLGIAHTSPDPQTSTVHSPVLTELSSTAEQVPCPTCGLYFPSQQIMRIHHTRKHGVSLHKYSRTTAAASALDLSKHSKGGMPICLHCQRSFSGWPELRYHLLNVCASAAPLIHSIDPPSTTALAYSPSQLQDVTEDLARDTQAELPESARQFAAGLPEASTDPTLPLCRNRSLLHVIKTPTWYLAFRLPGISQHLRHHCVFCDRWISHRSGALENHLRSQHPIIYRRQKDVRSICRTTWVARFSPCEACGSAFAKGTKHQCTILQHLGYLRLASGAEGSCPTLAFHDDDGPHSTPGDKGAFQGDPRSPDGGRGRPKERGERGAGSEEVRPSLLQGSGQRQGPPDGVRESSRIPRFTGSPGIGGASCSEGSQQCAGGQKLGQGTLLGWLAPKRPRLEPISRLRQPPDGRLGGEDEADSKGSPPPRGRAQPDEDGTSLRLDLRDEGGLGAESPLRVGDEVAREEGEARGGQPSSLNPFSGTPGALEDSSQGLGSGRTTAPTNYGKRPGHGEGGLTGAAVGIPEMESGHGAAGECSRGGAHAPVAGGGDSDSAGGDHRGPQCSGAIPRDPETGRDPGRGYHHLPDGGWTSGPDGFPGLGDDDQSLRPFCRTPHWAQNSTSEDGEAADCEGIGRKVSSPEGQGKGQGPRTRPITTRTPTRLGIPSGLRLINNSNICYINATCNLLHWMRQVHGNEHALGPLQTAMQGLSGRGRVYILSQLPWLHLLQSWHNIHAQQDASEFVAFLFSASLPAAYVGRWEARSSFSEPIPYMVVADSGTMATPLQLEVVGASLQQSIDLWHRQQHQHALCHPPPQLLLLHIKRFQPSEVIGVYRKDRSRIVIQAGEVLLLRCFSNEADVSFYTCRYRVVGMVYHIGSELKAGHYKAALSGAVRNSSRLAFYITDDSQPIVKVKGLPIEAQEGGYLVGLQLL